MGWPACSRADPQHPGPLRRADVDADPQQHRGDRHGRRCSSCCRRSPTAADARDHHRDPDPGARHRHHARHRRAGAGLVPALRRVGFRWRWRWRLPQAAPARAGPARLLDARSMSASARSHQVVVLAIAEGGRRGGGAGPAVFNNAFLIFMMAHGIVAVSVITALMPRMSAASADGRLRRRGRPAVAGHPAGLGGPRPGRRDLCRAGPAAGGDAVRLGAVHYDTALATGWVIERRGAGPAAVRDQPNADRAFYAMRDTRTPALVNIGGVAVRLLLDVAFYFILPIAAVTASLMVGTALSFVAALVMGYWLLRVRLGRLGLAKIADTLARLAGAAAVGGVLAFAVSWAIGQGARPGQDPRRGATRHRRHRPAGDLRGRGAGTARAGGPPVRRSHQGQARPMIRMHATLPARPARAREAVRHGRGWCRGSDGPCPEARRSGRNMGERYMTAMSWHG